MVASTAVGPLGLKASRRIAEANAELIALAVNNHAGLVAALEEIAQGSGAFSRDPLTHAANCIDNMKAIARAALANAKGAA
jgi:hypothetical protein